jgi:hypothetical protein
LGRPERRSWKLSVVATLATALCTRCMTICGLAWWAPGLVVPALTISIDQMKERLKAAVERAGSALLSAASRDCARTGRQCCLYIAEPSAALNRCSVQSAYGSGRAKWQPSCSQVQKVRLASADNAVAVADARRGEWRRLTPHHHTQGDELPPVAQVHDALGR